MIELPQIQIDALQLLFEQYFDNDHVYFDLIPIEDIFVFMCGQPLDYDFYNQLEETIFMTEENLAFACFLHEWMKVLIQSVEDNAVKYRVEFWETANNCKIFKDKIHEYIHSSDCGNI